MLATYTLSDRGEIRAVNNYFRQFDLPDLTLEFILSHVVNIVTATYVEDSMCYYNELLARISTLEEFCRVEGIALLDKLIAAMREELTRYKIIPNAQFRFKFGGFIGLTTDYMLIGG